MKELCSDYTLVVASIRFPQVSWRKESLRGKVGNVLDYDIVVSDFELKTYYGINFRTNALWKGLNPPIYSFPGMSYSDSTFTFLLQGIFWH